MTNPFSIFKKILRPLRAIGKGAGKALNHPAIDMGISIATLFLPGGQAFKFAMVLRQAREVERALGSGTGPQKFLAVWEALKDEPIFRDDRELKNLIEQAVMVIHKRLEVKTAKGATLAS